MTRELLLFLHLAGVVVWIGGMAFAHWCMRPAAVATLEPAQRLKLLCAALGRFFVAVAWALVAIWVSGISMFAQLSMAGGRPPLSWNLMALIALVMTAIFAVIWLRPHSRMQAALADGDLAAAAAALDRIRRLVVVNLGLGFLTIAVATIGRLAN
ncbi:MAG: hypothetical protein GX644_04670 [Limnobacter sp.]|nr:hypothetical protein [Limnobacter sp.]